ncbi:MAG: xanthine dehydrogenase family protein subunit M, partial [Chloroflexota bacterium]
IEFASKQPGTGSAYAKLFNPASRYAIVGAAAVITMNGNTCSAASVAIGGLLPSATRASSVEAALVGKEMTDANIQAAAEAVAADLGDDVMADIHASADYRRAMAVVYVKRAIETAVSRA